MEQVYTQHPVYSNSSKRHLLQLDQKSCDQRDIPAASFRSFYNGLLTSQNSDAVCDTPDATDSVPILATSPES